MGVFYHEESPNPSRKCKLSATLKDVICNCHTCGRLSCSSPEEEYPASDLEDEQESVVSEIRSRAMEKLKHRPFIITDSFSWVYSPKTGEMFITPKAIEGKDDEEKDGAKDDEKEEYLSVASCFSCCSSCSSREAFYSARTNFSRCSSFRGFEFQEFPKRSILQELCHCEGWPFGLCRRAVLLPPLPKSPSESWSWRRGGRIVKMA